MADELTRTDNHQARLLHPARLYGRDAAIHALLSAFDRTCRGNGEVLLVPGRSGIGKTVLVEQLREPVRRRNGFFLQGKFNQYFQNVPYFAVRQALAEFCRELLADDPSRQQQWRNDILDAVDGFGILLVDLVPELEGLLGKQPPVQEISPQEALHRFVRVLRGFFGAICKPEHPLVLFIDDWQWADRASLHLLKQLQLDNRSGYLLFIVSYRDDEIDSTHPLTFTLEDLNRQATPIETIDVRNLTLGEVQQLAQDSLPPRVENLSSLADFLYGRTQGNPFFVREFLLFLSEAVLLAYAAEDACWKFSSNSCATQATPLTVVDLFAHRIGRLPRNLRQLLLLAACLGSRFDLETLALISKTAPDECGKLLLDAEKQRLVVAVRDGSASLFEFRHDRIQQAAHGLIDGAELPALHLKIGRMLLDKLSAKHLDERLFEVVEHLNTGCRLIDDAAESLKIIELNVMAARKARSATAYAAVLQFHRAAWMLMENPVVAGRLWSERHDLAMALLKERAESEFLEGDRDEAEHCIHLAVEHARTAIEKAEALNILIVQYTLQAKYPEAISFGRKALEILGISLPDDNFEVARDSEIARVRERLANRTVGSLMELPVMSDAAMCTASRILITMGPPCYRSDQRLWSVIVPKVVNLTLEYGHIPQIGYSHTAFAGLLGWVDNDYATAREFAELATQLMARYFPAPSDQSVFYLMIGGSVRHWFRHLRHGSEDYAEAYEIGLRSGNLQYAAYAFGHNMYCRFYQGVALETLILESRHSLHFSRTRLNQWAIDLLEGGIHLFGLLAGDETEDQAFEPDYLRRVDAHRNIQVQCIYKVLKACALLMLGQHQRALALSDEAESLIYTVGTQGLLPWPEHRFARFLIITSLYAEAGPEQQRAWAVELRQILEQLRLWTEHCPDNFEHKYLLAAAEWARLQNQPGRAMHLYEQASEAARTGNFLQWQGLANERAAAFWQEQGDGRLEQSYWQQAYLCFARWGAVAKLRLMEGACRERISDSLLEVGAAARDEFEQHGDFRELIVEKQVRLLREQASQADLVTLREEASRKADELAKAMEHLRIEVAERKRAEDALRESRLRLELALKSARMGAWNYDLLENRRYFDDTTCELFGLNPSAFSGRAEEFFQVVHPEDHAAIRAAIKRTIEHDTPYEETYRIVNDVGEIRYIMSHGRVVRDEAGRASRLYGLVEDVTERRSTERERELLIGQLQEKTAELERFVYTVSHDLKSPLVTVAGFAELLKEDFIARDEERFQSSLSHITQAAQRMRQLLDDLLEFLRIGFKRHPPELVNLGTLVEAAIINVSGRLHDVNAVIDVSQEFPDVLVDPKGFLQVFENLIDNAAKFSSGAAGGPSIQIGVRKDAGALVCYVKDNGVGIEPGDTGKVFELFEKLDHRSNGTGVGLAIVKRIVEMHDGKIWIESGGQGQGTSFCFTVPIAADGTNSSIPRQSRQNRS